MLRALQCDSVDLIARYLLIAPLNIDNDGSWDGRMKKGSLLPTPLLPSHNSLRISKEFLSVVLDSCTSVMGKSQ